MTISRGVQPTIGSRPNDCSCLDVVSDALAAVRRIRAPTVLDTGTGEALTIAVDTSLPTIRVVQVLGQRINDRFTPKANVRDNGPEWTRHILDQWAYDHNVELKPIDRWKPI